MCNVSKKSCELLWYAKKQKTKVFTRNIYVYFRKNNFSKVYEIWALKLDMPQNQYITAEMNRKYPRV